jgi:peptide/nickel transport system ATP-binding protein
VREALSFVGLSEDLPSRRPAALSGGQRQRVAGIVEVLATLQAELGLTYVFVSHDLALVRQLAHTVSVMHRGRIVESGTV